MSDRNHRKYPNVMDEYRISLRNNPEHRAELFRDLHSRHPYYSYGEYGYYYNDPNRR